MRILVVSMLYPPVALGGYEVECASVVERLRERHDVLVLTCNAGGASLGSTIEAPSGAEPGVRRELALLSADWRGALRAPRASLAAVGVARRALAWGPDLVYVWNGSYIPQATLRVLADSRVPLAFRVCEHWFGELFVGDQFMRELLPADRGAARALWAAGARALNRLPSLRLQPLAPAQAAISWNSEAIRRMVATPAFLEPVLERVGHSVPRYGELYAQVTREQAPRAEIVYLGRITAFKGLSVAIEALALLRSAHGLDATLTVVGTEDGDYGAEMRQLAERRGVASAVRWFGQATPAQAAGLLGRASVLILPSTWEEPFPLVTIEAALARAPIVASDVGGVSEGMHDEEHALLFACGDASAAAAALVRTLHEREATAARVMRAFERAKALFGLGPYLDAQERFVLDALELSRHSGAVHA